jgi:chemotaxis methyl-accepting protein methylase
LTRPRAQPDGQGPRPRGRRARSADDRVSPEPSSPDEASALAQIFEIVRERRGIDFNGYRRSTLLRRVHNRMISAGAPTFSEYLHRLTSAPEETDALIERLTIKVSHFFRNRSMFDALRSAIEDRLEERVPLAVWSAGCGCGEEAYSLAMLLDELGRSTASILATDIDRSALSIARAGRYPFAPLDGLEDHERARYFDAGEDGGRAIYCAKPQLRAMIEVCVHDLTGSTPPPGERVFDLIACRNVLIYLEPPLQARVLRLLSAQLSPGGLLWLGEAEWLVSEVASRFIAIDQRARLFRLRAGGREAGICGSRG